MKVWVETSACLSRLTMNALTCRPSDARDDGGRIVLEAGGCQLWGVRCLFCYVFLLGR